MPVNLAAAAILATGFWAISAWSIIAQERSAPRDLWTVTSSDKIRSHPTLTRASVPRSLASARATHVARLQAAQAASR